MTKYECIEPLRRAGIDPEHALALRRISMTLHRWHELECGDGDDRRSWCIARGRKENGAFVYDDNGPPFMETHYHHGAPKPHYTRLSDRERGAMARLKVIMANYPTLSYYIQGDPRGAALYILRPGDVRDGASPDSCYTNGIAVYK